MIAFAVADLGRSGYAIGFVVFVFLALLSLSVAWVLKYTMAPVGPVTSRACDLAEAGGARHG
jgi:hypothetical protein